jgi:hypothetical protein
MAKQEDPGSAARAAGEGQSTGLAGELHDLIGDAEQRGNKAQHWARFWQVVDIVLGLAATVLAAVAGAAGLATAAGRVPAAIIALIAAGLAAANQFLHSGERYERNRRRRSAWQALERDARLEHASTREQGESDTESLYDVMRELLRRRIAIMDMDHRSVPPDALTGSAHPSAGSGQASSPAAG